MQLESTPLPMVSRSRFERIEHVRDTPQREEPSTPEHRRFDTTPQVEPGPVLEPRAPELARFDGSEGLRLDDHDLKRLPTIICAACHTENGKFEKTCYRCRAPLDDLATTELNLTRLATLDAEEASTRERAAQLRAQELEEQVQLSALERQRYVEIAQEVAKRHSESVEEGLARYERPAAASAGALFFFVMLVSADGWLKRLIAVVLMATCILIALPAQSRVRVIRGLMRLAKRQ